MPKMNAKGFFPRMRRWIGAAIVLASVGMLLWGLWPSPTTLHRLELSADELGMPYGRQVRLEWPARLQQGDHGEVNLVLDAPEQPSAVPPVPLVARLEFPALEIDPPGEQQEGLNPTLPARFTWKVVGYRPGRYSGTAWLYRTVSAGNSSADQQPLMAPRFDIEVHSLAGLGGPLARGLSLVGLILGAGLILWPFRWRPAD